MNKLFCKQLSSYSLNSKLIIRGISNEKISALPFTRLRDIQGHKGDDLIRIRGRVHSLRVKGNLAFIVLRQDIDTLQAIAVKSEEISKETLKMIKGISNESIVDVCGTLQRTEKEVKMCTVKDVELQVKGISLVSMANSVLPFQIDDSMRKIDSNEGDLPTVTLKTKLDNRVIDLRSSLNQSIFRVRSGITTLFREFLMKKNYIEIHTPKILGGSSEGGSEVFRLDYFDKQACLAQSPQLYKQMMIMGDFDGVYEVGSVFRAENANTHRHLCEFIGLDVEMRIETDHLEVIKMANELFFYIFSNIEKRYERELEIVRRYTEAEPIQFGKEPTVLDYKEAVDLLNSKGYAQDYDSDLSTERERQLGAIVKQLYETDYFAIMNYPSAIKPFYTKPNPNKPESSNSFDIFLRGQEIVSGGQRIEDPVLLEQRVKEKGIDPTSLQDYLNAFRYGSYKHGGFGIGLERLVMLYLGLKNIREVSAFPRDPARLRP